MADTTVHLEIVVDQELALRALLSALEETKKPVFRLVFGPVSEQNTQKEQ